MIRKAMTEIKSRFLIKQLNRLYKLISHPYSFLFAFIVVVLWFVTGLPNHYDASWYKWFHIFEMTITFLMIFIIESTVQADNRAMQEKLDEIIKKLPQTDNKIAGIEKKYKGEK